MAGAVATRAIRRSFQPSFFFWMTVIMAVFVFGGFSLTYLMPMASGTLPPLPPAVHVHGVLYFGWMVMLITQAFLINVKNVRLHRSVGTFGISLATALLISGAVTAILFAKATKDTPNVDYYYLMYLSVVAVVSFGTLFTMAIRNTDRPETHRMLILLATLNLLPPGINRLYMVAFGSSEAPLLATFLTMDALALAVLFHFWRSHGKLNGAAITGAAFVLVPQILSVPIVSSAAFVELTAMLTGLARYR